MNMKSIKMTKRNMVIAIGILVAIGFLGYHFLAPKKAAPTYQTEQAARGTLVVSISASGQVSSVNNASVTTQSSGVVTKLLAHNGDVVKPGQPLVQIQLDQNGLQNRAQAYASYISAVNSEKAAEQGTPTNQSTLEAGRKAIIDAQTAVDTMNNNRNQGYPNPATHNPYTQNEIDSINSTLTSAREAFSGSEQKYLNTDTAISAAKAAVASSWLSYQQSGPVIMAPIGGVVDGLALEPGSVITQTNSSSSTNTSTSGTSSSQKVGTIKTELTPLVTINLTEIDVPKVKVGDKATLTFDSFPDKSYTGSVISIDSSGAVSSGVTTYPTVIQLDTEVPELFANMTASANIITNTVDDTILVSSAAVQTSGTQSTVRVLRNGKPQTVTVQTGLSSDTQTAITSGLSEGDNVIDSVTTNSAAAQATSTGTSPFTRSFGGAGGGGSGFGGRAGGGGGRGG